MGMRSTVAFTTGPAGTGKSYRRCAYLLVEEFLPFSEGVHLSNFPIKFDPWTDAKGRERAGLVAVMEKRGMSESVVRDRVKLISPETMDSWRPSNKTPSGPWESLADFPLTGTHLAIDEIHEFCGESSKLSTRRQWSEWLGQIRHRGATIEFLSQHPTKVAKEITREAEVKIQLTSNRWRLDPLFGIQMEYWYQLRGKLGLGYKSATWQAISREVLGKWEVQETKPFRFDTELFDVYDSHSAPQTGGKSGFEEKPAYERMNWRQFAGWFLMSNFFQIGTRTAYIAAATSAICFRTQLVDLYFQFFQTKGFGMVGSVDEPAEPPTGASAAAARVVAAAKDDPQRMRDELEHYMDLWQQVSMERDAAAQQRDQLLQRVGESFIVAAIEPGKVVFKGGDSYGVGERIEFGPYEGKTVERIEYDRRIVRLSGAVVLRLPGGDDIEWLQTFAAAKREQSAPEFRGTLRAPGGEGANDRASARIGRNQSNDKRLGDASR